MTVDDDPFATSDPPGGSDSDPADADDGPTFEEKARAFGIPWPVVKASEDPFDYAVGLRDGSVFFFEHCAIDADYKFVTLLGVRAHSFPPPRHGLDPNRDMQLSFARGVVVRVEDILWAADGPYES